MPAKKTVYLNGAFVAIDRAASPVADPAFLSGPGLFETMRSRRNKIICLDEHLRRIKISAPSAGLKFNYAADKIKSAIRKTVRLNKLQDAYVRLTIWRSRRGAGVLVAAQRYAPYPLKKYKEGFSACVSSLKQNDPSAARIKCVNRLFYEMALKEAHGKGCDEAVILNAKGQLTEASRSNIFLVKGGQIFTPLLECGCLDGITRRAVLGLAKKNKIKASEAALNPQDIYFADEAFLTNSLIGIMPLTSLNGRALGKGRGRITALLSREYSALLKK